VAVRVCDGDLALGSGASVGYSQITIWDIRGLAQRRFPSAPDPIRDRRRRRPTGTATEAFAWLTTAVSIGTAAGRRRRSFRENCAQGGLELDQVILALVTEAEAAIDASVRPPWADPAVLRGPRPGSP